MRARIIVASLLALAAVACGGGGGKKAETCLAGTTVDTKDATTFAPACVTVAPGATVTWRDADNVPHTVTFTSGDAFAKYFENGASVTRKFDAAGTFPYYCKVHGKQMSGKVIVTAPTP